MEDETTLSAQLRHRETIVLGMVRVLYTHKFLNIQGQPCEQSFKRAGIGLAVSMLLSAGIFYNTSHRFRTQSLF